MLSEFWRIKLIDRQVQDNSGWYWGVAYEVYAHLKGVGEICCGLKLEGIIRGGTVTIHSSEQTVAIVSPT